MNWNIVEGNWKQFKGLVTARWGKLTDDNLDVIAGNRDVLAGKIQESYGITKDEVEEQIKSFEERNKDFQPRTTRNSLCSQPMNGNPSRLIADGITFYNTA